MSTARKTTSNIYQLFQLLNKGALSLSGVCMDHLRLNRSHPVSTTVMPSTSPISIPTLIFLIIIPSASPSMMAKMNDISALRTSGFCGDAICLIYNNATGGPVVRNFFSYSMR